MTEISALTLVAASPTSRTSRTRRSILRLLRPCGCSWHCTKSERRPHDRGELKKHRLTRRTLCRRHHEHPPHTPPTNENQIRNTHSNTNTLPRPTLHRRGHAKCSTDFNPPHAKNTAHAELSTDCTANMHTHAQRTCNSRMTRTGPRPMHENAARAKTPHAHKSPKTATPKSLRK